VGLAGRVGMHQLQQALHHEVHIAHPLALPNQKLLPAKLPARELRQHQRKLLIGQRHYSL
jgi:hypothetical protein